MAYKTPGVYVEEKSIFPPSVAQVATAIPAFIGYTEKATERLIDDLRNVPKKIASLLEYRQFFGESPPLNITGVRINENNALVDASIQPRFYLYDSLQLFFANGGGECYIISVGSYSGNVQKGNRANPSASPGFDVGLAALEKYDEPTLILFPDAVLLQTDTDFYDLQKAVLAQCNALKDRFAIFDLRERNAGGNFDWEGQREAFRNNIGTQFLRYGAAYTPHLQTIIQKNIHYRDVYQIITRGGASVNLRNLTTEADVQSRITLLETAIADSNTITNTINTSVSTFFAGLPTPPNPLPTTLAQGFQILVDRFNAAGDDATRHTCYGNIFDFLYRIVVIFDDFRFTTPVAGAQLLTTVTNLTATALSLYRQLIALDRGAESIWNGQYNRYTVAGNTSALTPGNWGGVNPGTASTLPAADATPFGVSGSVTNRLRSGLPTLNQILVQLNAMMTAIADASRSIENELNNWLYTNYPVFKNLIDALNKTMSTIPPSGAIAGVYAQVDANRGVWKAPANVSLSGLAGLTYTFSLAKTDDLNVDVNFGKSINAIQFMTGMGFMVWGARTLAGNDNEWRYISVRRFFNMVEESVKKSTMWAVFEPNDANTWVKVKGMIENFLTLQWRAGALQGAKPDQAFFVKVGLGETMTALDILEGRMNVEIGMAVVRPAEFIILTFSHKLPES